MSTTIEALRGMLYQSQFRALIAEVENTDLRVRPEVMELKASALFELHRIDDVRAVAAQLKVLASQSEVALGEFLFLQGKIHYFEDRFELAEESFRLALGHQGRPRVRAGLGLGNVYFSAGKRDQAASIVDELRTMDCSEQLDLQISIAMLQGNISLVLDKAADQARAQFSSAFGMATPRGWTYFMHRALHGLARVARSESKPEEMRAYLSILRTIVDEKESLFMTHLINEWFMEDSFAIESAVDFDDLRMTIRVRDEWKSLNERPLVYRLLRFLHGCSEFVNKETIAKSLWADEHYHPETHDPRIYDLARRARSIVEAFDAQPIVLLSGRSGYRLATTKNGETK